MGELNRKLLIVEDDPGLLRQLKCCFEGYDVFTAEDRESAIVELRRHEPAVVLQDLGLPPDPEGLEEGLATMSETLKLAPHTKVVVLIDNVGQETAMSAVAQGAYDFYEKPVDTDTLKLLVDRAFNIAELEAVQVIWDKQPERARQLVQESASTMRSGLQDTRRALQALRAEPLESVGFVASIHQLAESIRARYEANVTVEAPADVVWLSQDQEHIVYRITQEALLNSAQHAQAQQITVELVETDQTLDLSVMDDGIGFDPAAIATHTHFDHVLAADALRAQTGAPFRIHREAQPGLEALQVTGRLFGMELPPPPEPDSFIEVGEVITEGAIALDVLFTPGHMPGHVSFVLRSEEVVFSGDCLFQGSIGRTDLPGGNHDVLMDSIQEQLLPLGDAFRVASGHGPWTTIGQERASNPFLTMAGW